MNKNEIVLIHGTDYADMTVRLLTQIDLSSIIGNKAARVAVKPNLVIADTADRGAVTHPEIVDGVLRYLSANGFENVRVIEGSWVGDRTSVAFEESGIAEGHGEFPHILGTEARQRNETSARGTVWR